MKQPLNKPLALISLGLFIILIVYTFHNRTTHYSQSKHSLPGNITIYLKAPATADSLLIIATLAFSPALPTDNLSKIEIFANNAKIDEYPLYQNKFRSMLRATNGKDPVLYQIGQPIPQSIQTIKCLIPKEIVTENIVLQFHLVTKGNSGSKILINRLKLYPQIYKYGEKINFGGLHKEYSMKGWVENTVLYNYSWAIAASAEIVLPVAASRSDLRLLVNMASPLLWKHLRHQTVLVTINGVKAAEWTVSANGIFSAKIPGQLTHSNLLRIKFSFPDAVSPWGDCRMRSIPFVSLCVEK